MALEAVDCYSLLGVRPGAGGPDLGEALERRRTALDRRQGVVPTDVDALRNRLGEAYGILLDPARERLYRIYLSQRGELPRDPDTLADLAVPAELPRPSRGRPLLDRLLRPGTLESLLEPAPWEASGTDADEDDPTEDDVSDETDWDATDDDGVRLLGDAEPRVPTSPTLRAALDSAPPVREDAEPVEVPQTTASGPVIRRIERPPWEGRVPPRARPAVAPPPARLPSATGRGPGADERPAPSPPLAERASAAPLRPRSAPPRPAAPPASRPSPPVRAREPVGEDQATLPPWAGYTPDPAVRSGRSRRNAERLGALLPEGSPPGPGSVPGRGRLLAEVLLDED